MSLSHPLAAPLTGAITTPIQVIAFALPTWFAWDPLLPYCMMFSFLTIGLVVAIKNAPANTNVLDNAPANTNVLDRILLLGPVFIAMPMAVFGSEHFTDAALVARMVPAWIPFHLFWVYSIGSCLILGGLSIALQKHDWLAAACFGTMLLCFEVLLHIPAVIGDPHNRLPWMVAFRDFSFSMGALSLAATHSRSSKPWAVSALLHGTRTATGIVLVIFGVQYLLHPELLPGVPLRQLTPQTIWFHTMWGYPAGVAFIAAGICLALNKRAHLAAASLGSLILVLVLVFNVPFLLLEPAQRLDVPVDTLLFCGSVLAMAASIRNLECSRYCPDQENPARNRRRSISV